MTKRTKKEGRVQIGKPPRLNPPRLAAPEKLIRFMAVVVSKAFRKSLIEALLYGKSCKQRGNFLAARRLISPLQGLNCLPQVNVRGRQMCNN